MRIPWSTMAVAAIAVAGCATTAEQAARMEREMDSYIQIYGPACLKLGYQPDTDPWRNCILRLVMYDGYWRYGYGYYGYYGYRYYPMSIPPAEEQEPTALPAAPF